MSVGVRKDMAKLIWTPKLENSCVLRNPENRKRLRLVRGRLVFSLPPANAVFAVGSGCWRWLQLAFAVAGGCGRFALRSDTIDALYLYLCSLHIISRHESSRMVNPIHRLQHVSAALLRFQSPAGKRTEKTTAFLRGFSQQIGDW
ncbi:hypothetical protein YC2023_001154 [Brassica napus]